MFVEEISLIETWWTLVPKLGVSEKQQRVPQQTGGCCAGQYIICLQFIRDPCFLMGEIKLSS